METEAAAQESLGLGKLGTQAEKDRRLKKKQVWRFFFSLLFLTFTLYHCLWGIKNRVIGKKTIDGGQCYPGIPCNYLVLQCYDYKHLTIKRFWPLV